MIKYRLLQTADIRAWDDFVDNHPDGRFSHLGSYTVSIEQTFGLKGYALGFFDENELVGVLPSFLIKPFAGQNRLISMPFSDYGGILLKNDTVLDSAVLTAALDMLLNSSSASYLTMKGAGCNATSLPDNICSGRHDCDSVMLKLDEPAKMYKSLDHSIRKNLKRAEENGLVCEHDYNEDIVKLVFYPMYLRKMKEFGTPPYPLTFFLNMAGILRERVKLFTIKYRDDTASLLWAVKTNNFLNILFILSNKRYLAYRPNDLVHWEMIKWAYTQRCRFFDFGVARYEGQAKFKGKWGTSFYDYSHYYYPPSKELLSKPIYSTPSLANRMWSKYMPLRLGALIGPVIRKKLGR